MVNSFVEKLKIGKMDVEFIQDKVSDNESLNEFWNYLKIIDYKNTGNLSLKEAFEMFESFSKDEDHVENLSEEELNVLLHLVCEAITYFQMSIDHMINGSEDVLSMSKEEILAERKNMIKCQSKNLLFLKMARHNLQLQTPRILRGVFFNLDFQ